MREDLDNEQQEQAFHSLFTNDVPIMDVRAPVEFALGAFPSATNWPILDDEQRHLIGCEYAEQGQDAAIKLGLELATPSIRQQRLKAWREFTVQNPEGYLYCFRGGLRSRTTQQWLAEQGCKYPLIKGGYKAMRSYLLQQLERLCAEGNLLLLAGPTGCGKTEVIHAWPQSLDFEGRAKHRGSAFGRTLEPQPAQIDWENQIAIDWLKCEKRHNSPVLVEAESHLIGRVNLPEPLRQAMEKAPVLMLEASTAERVKRLREDYVSSYISGLKNKASANGGSIAHQPWEILQEDTAGNLTRIKKRLGGDLYEKLMAQLPLAISSLRDENNSTGMDAIIGSLLSHYYDKTYTYQQDKQADRVICRGDAEHILKYLRSHRAL